MGGIRPPPSRNRVKQTIVLVDLIPDSDAILKILSVDFCGKVKVNSDSSSNQ